MHPALVLAMTVSERLIEAIRGSARIKTKRFLWLVIIVVDEVISLKRPVVIVATAVLVGEIILITTGVRLGTIRRKALIPPV